MPTDRKPAPIQHRGSEMQQDSLPSPFDGTTPSATTATFAEATDQASFVAERRHSRRESESATGMSPSAGSSNEKDIPPAFLCPISKQVMKDPVMDSDGITYDRESINRWMRTDRQAMNPSTNEGNGGDEGRSYPNNPATGRVLKRKQLVPNRALRDVIYTHMGPDWSKEAEKSIENVQADLSPMRRRRRRDEGSVSHLDSPSTDVDISGDSAHSIAHYAAMVDSFLNDYIRTVIGADHTIHLNEQGACVLQYRQFRIEVKVRFVHSVGESRLFVSTSVGPAPPAPASTTSPPGRDSTTSAAPAVAGEGLQEEVESAEEAYYKKVLHLNHMQYATRGSTLSLDERTDGMLFWYSDTISDMNSTDFRNILTNFADTARKLDEELRTGD